MWVQDFCKSICCLCRSCLCCKALWLVLWHYPLPDSSLLTISSSSLCKRLFYIIIFWLHCPEIQIWVDALLVLKGSGPDSSAFICFLLIFSAPAAVTVLLSSSLLMLLQEIDRTTPQKSRKQFYEQKFPVTDLTRRSILQVFLGVGFHRVFNSSLHPD